MSDIETLPAASEHTAPLSRPSAEGGADDATLIGEAAAGAGGHEDEDRRGAWVPERIGRFRVLEQLGAGGMGVVYSAYDGDLDRKVAIKLLRFSSGDDASSVGHARLLREAQAMARLSHPQVIQVYEVGTHRGDVFVAMEFVRGRALSSWLEADPAPSLAQVLDVFVQAGRGLAAAHQSGLVHRDFKPDNVMVGDDGRVRVLDFGLARTSDSQAMPPGVAADPEALARAEASSLASMTQTGALMGTPAYMAPEQWRGESVDARTDQFSFCVALWEACYGARPFPGSGPAQLCAAVLAAKITPPPADAGVPARIEEILRRGLADAPSGRWPDMAALLDALADDPALRRRRWMWVGVGAVAVAGASMGLGLWSAPAAAPEPCTGARDQIAQVWNPARADALREAFFRDGASYAQTTWASTQPMFDAWAQAWAQVHREACLAAHNREQSQTMLDLRMSCLDRRRQELDALIEALSVGDEAVLSRALQAASALRPPADCSDLEALAQAVPLPDDAKARTQIERARADIARVRATRESGHYREALERAQRVYAQVEPVDYRPVRAEAEFMLADALDWAGQTPESMPHFKRAAFEALAVRDDALFVDAANQVLWIYGDVLGEPDLAKEWGTQAASVLDRMGGDRRLECSLHNAMGATLMRAGELDEATREHERALELARAEWGEGSAMTVRSLVNLGNIERVRGQAQATLDHYRAAAAVAIQAWGAEHPQTLKIRVNVLTAQASAGDWRSMIADGPQLLAAQERALGKDHPDAVTTLNELSNAYRWSGDNERGLALLRDAQARTQSWPPEAYPNYRLDVLSNIARVEASLGHIDDARAHCAQMLEAAQSLYGDDNARLSTIYVMAAEIAGAAGDDATAMQRYEKAREITIAHLGEQHRNVGKVELGIGGLLTDRGEHPRALERYDRAAAVFEADGAPSIRDLELTLNRRAQSEIALSRPDQARASLDRARALDGDDPEQALDTELLYADLQWASGEHQTARQTARAARAVARDADEPRLVAGADRWLAEHAGE